MEALSAGESKSDKVISQKVQEKIKEMWHPTAEFCYYLAFVFKEILPRNRGFVPMLLKRIREMLSSKLTVLNLSENQITDAVAQFTVRPSRSTLSY